MKTFAILVRGIPGSGKSTFGQALAEYLNIPKVEADDYFIKDGNYEFTKELLPVAHEYCQLAASEAARDYTGVVVCNTFVKIAEMDWYFKNFDTVLVMKKPHRVYNNTHNIPEEVIQRMISEWEDCDGELRV